jgi:hypothetical protein
MALHVGTENESLWAKFDKIESPFAREFDERKEYRVVNRINDGYEWCFGNKDVVVTEKLDGTNSAYILHKDGSVGVFQRDSKSKVYRRLGVYEGNYPFILAAAADHIARYKPEQESFHAGETIGVHVNGNPYRLDGYRFMEFKLHGAGHLPRYEFGIDRYPPEPDSAKWKEWLLSAKSKLNGLDYLEGVVFWHKRTGEMAKLRRDMF